LNYFQSSFKTGAHPFLSPKTPKFMDL